MGERRREGGRGRGESGRREDRGSTIRNKELDQVWDGLDWRTHSMLIHVRLWGGMECT